MKKALVLATLVVAGVLLPGTAAQAEPGEPVINCRPVAGSDGGTCAESSDCMINIQTGAATCSTDYAERRAVGTVTHAMLYSEPNYKGYALRYVSNQPCTDDKTTAEYGDPSFDNPLWNNEVESVRTFNNCRIRLFRWVNYAGGSTNWIHEWADLRTGDNWANNVSSIKIS